MKMKKCKFCKKPLKVGEMNRTAHEKCDLKAFVDNLAKWHNVSAKNLVEREVVVNNAEV